MESTPPPTSPANGASQPGAGPNGPEQQGLEPSAAAPSGGAPGAAEPGLGGDGFVAATLAELRKVVWPSRQQLFSESVAVILMVGLSAAAIAAVDRFYGWASSQVFR